MKRDDLRYGPLGESCVVDLQESRPLEVQGPALDERSTILRLEADCHCALREPTDCCVQTTSPLRA
jgi:hypothetical protein